MGPRSDAPRRFIRVEAMIGFGWPRCTRREFKARNFQRVTDAQRWVDNIRARPSHHELLGVYESTPVEWEAFAIDEQPPLTHDDVEMSHDE